jgi:hypothetical protein
MDPHPALKNLIEALNEICLLLKNQESQLAEIRNSDGSLIEKWQKFLSVILPIQIMVIHKHGYAASQKGLSEFNQLLMQEAKENAELKKLNDDKWIYLFRTAFGLTELKVISLEDAQQMTKDIADAVTSEAFLQAIDERMAALKEGTMLERRQRLLDVLIPAQMKIMERYGFSGEEGYIQAQRALLDYFFDPVVTRQFQRAQDLIFKRANLMS